MDYYSNPPTEGPLEWSSRYIKAGMVMNPTGMIGLRFVATDLNWSFVGTVAAIKTLSEVWVIPDAPAGTFPETGFRLDSVEFDWEVS